MWAVRSALLVKLSGIFQKQVLFNALLEATLSFRPHKLLWAIRYVVCFQTWFVWAWRDCKQQFWEVDVQNDLFDYLRIVTRYERLTLATSF